MQEVTDKKSTNKHIKDAAKILISFVIILFTVITVAGNKTLLDDMALNWNERLYGFVRIFFVICMAALLCASVMRIELLVKTYKETEHKKGFFHALFFSVSFILIFNPLDNARISLYEFNRVVGMSVTSGVDVSKRINNFNMWFIMLIISFSIFMLLFNHILNVVQSDERQKVKEFLGHFMVIANCVLVLRCITYFSDVQNNALQYNFSYDTIMLIALLSLLYIIAGFDRYVSADIYAKLMLAGVALAYAIAILSRASWNNGKLVIIIMTVLAFGIAFLLRFIKPVKRDISDSAINMGVILLSFIPLASSTFIELIHILNQNKVFVENPGRLYFVIFALFFACSAVSVYIVYRKNILIKSWKKVAYPAFLTGIGCLALQLPLVNVCTSHIFEGANYGILISDFLNHGDVPIVEHYGGHMMTNVWSGILYGILNNDYTGAFVSPYLQMVEPLYMLLFYYVVKTVWNRDMAFLMTLLFPFMNYISYYAMGILICISAIAFINKSTYPRAALFWLSVIWCGTYRLDLTLAFVVAAAVVMALYIVIEKNHVAIKKLAVTLTLWAVTGVGAWVLICISRGISPVSRLREFLVISLSNLNWAYASMGSNILAAYSWFYIFIPFAVIISLLVLIFNKKIHRNTDKKLLMITLMIGLAHMANFSRGLVRHSLAEMNIILLMWSSYLYFAMFISVYKSNKKLFLPVFMIFILFNAMFYNNNMYTYPSYADKSVQSPDTAIKTWYEKTNEGMTYWEAAKQNETVADRIVLSDELHGLMDKFAIVDAILTDDETFIDFTNSNLIYPLLGKQSPVYISQIPIQMSGEYAQEQFIDEINGVPLVILGVDTTMNEFSTQLDGVPHLYRYYLVAEYLYENYVPLFKCNNDYAVWCVKDRYNEFYEKADAYMAQYDIDKAESSATYEFIDYAYDGPFVTSDEEGNEAYEYFYAIHNYGLGYLPRLWAEADVENAGDNQIVAETVSDNGYYTFDTNAILGSDNGNYIKISAEYDDGLPSDEDIIASVILGKYTDGQFVEKCACSMYISEGRHDYLIRISADYYWYIGDINAIKLPDEEKLTNINISVLEGD